MEITILELKEYEDDVVERLYFKSNDDAWDVYRFINADHSGPDCNCSPGYCWCRKTTDVEDMFTSDMLYVLRQRYKQYVGYEAKIIKLTNIEFEEPINSDDE